MAKADDQDLKELASETTQALGPIKKQIEDVLKIALIMSKDPNAKLAEALATKIEDIMSATGEMKDLAKKLEKASA